VRIGPVDYASFRRLMPGGECLQPTCQLVRSYVGCEYLFDIQVVLKANEIPPCKLGHPDPQRGGASLGWNTWLCSRTPNEDREDAVFRHDGAPSAVAT
jgi:type VI secretion system protein ImpH